MKPKLLEGDPPELIVLDNLEPCPYLDGETARMPLRMPLRKLTPREFDRRMGRGDRRHGRFLYRPSCPACRACEAIRLDARRFRPSRSHRRTLVRGDRELTVDVGEPIADDERLELFEKHRTLRGLDREQRALDRDEYQAFFVERCVDSFELRFRLRGRLVGAAITDRGGESLSAVYCFYDPELSHLGIGTYAVLNQLELCRRWRLRHLYLGLYIAGNARMNYKARFRPHERLVGGVWREFP